MNEDSRLQSQLERATAREPDRNSTRKPPNCARAGWSWAGCWMRPLGTSTRQGWCMS
jgi:hypothetical protein